MQGLFTHYSMQEKSILLAIMTIVFFLIFFGGSNSVFATSHIHSDEECGGTCPKTPMKDDHYKCKVIGPGDSEFDGLTGPSKYKCVWNDGAEYNGKKLYSLGNTACSGECNSGYECKERRENSSPLLDGGNSLQTTVLIGHQCIWSFPRYLGKPLHETDECGIGCRENHLCEAQNETIPNSTDGMGNPIYRAIGYQCVWDPNAQHDDKKLYSPRSNNCHNQCVLGTRCVGAEGVDGYQCLAIYKGRDLYDNENCSEQCGSDMHCKRVAKNANTDRSIIIGWYCKDGTGSSEAEEYCDPAYEICNPINSTSFTNLISRIIDWFTIIAGSVLTLMVVYAGFLYTTSAGSTDQTNRAKSVIKHAVIGFIIITLAYVIKSIIGDIL